MILLDTEKHVFIAHNYADMASQLLEHLQVTHSTTLAALAAACLGVNELNVMTTHTTP